MNRKKAAAIMLGLDIALVVVLGGLGALLVALNLTVGLIYAAGLAVLLSWMILSGAAERLVERFANWLLSR